MIAKIQTETPFPCRNCKKKKKKQAKMAEKENAERKNDLREKALEAQRSVGVVTELVDAVHRHSLAAKASEAALTTEVNELKIKTRVSLNVPKP